MTDYADIFDTACKLASFNVNRLAPIDDRYHYISAIHPLYRDLLSLHMKIEPGESVILVLHTPREKLLGIVDEINPSGVFVRGIDLGYFDDWCQSIADGEQYLPMSDYFLPMWRLERMMRDEGSEGTPSMTEQFEQRTGRKLSEF